MQLEIREAGKESGVKTFGVWDVDKDGWVEGIKPAASKNALQGPILRAQMYNCSFSEEPRGISQCHIEVHEIAMHFPEWLKLHEKK